MKATRPVFVAAAVLSLVIVLFPLGGCADDSTQTMAAGTQTTTTASVKTTTTTLIETATTQAPTTTEFTTTTTTLPAGGPGPAEVVVSVSFDGEVFQEEWGDAPCVWEDVETSVMQGNKMVKKTVRKCEWPFWVRLSEQNGVAVKIERYARVILTDTGEEVPAGGHLDADWFVIAPGGTYERGFRPTSEDGRPDIAGNIYGLTIYGFDANGNDVELEIRLRLSPPS